MKFKHYFLIPVFFTLILVSVFFITRGYSPEQSELAFIEHSTLGKSFGSVIPASCNSDPHYVGDCAPPQPPTATLSVSAHSLSFPYNMITANPVTINYGNRATLSYNSAYATACTLYANGVDVSSWGGGLGYTWNNWGPYFSSVTYGLTCTGPGGSVTPPSVTVNVLPQAPPSTPVGLTAVAGDCDMDSIQVSWSPSGPSSNISSYTLLDGGVVIYTGASPSFRHSPLVKSSVHTYQVRATNGAGSSAYTAVIQGTAPSGVCVATPVLSGAPGSCGMNPSSVLTWNSVPNAVTYTLLRRESNWGVGSGAPIYNGSALSYTDNQSNSFGFSPNTDYYYSISARDSNWRESNISSELLVTSPDSWCPNVSKPINVQAVAGTCDQGITVSWDPVAYASGYRVVDTTTNVQVYDGPAASFAHTSVAPSTQHGYRVQAYNATNWSLWSNPSSLTMSANACGGTPIPPQSISVIPGACSTGKINIYWEAGRFVASYKLMHSENGGPFNLLYSGTDLSFQHEGLSQWSGHEYQIIASNSKGDSPGPTDFQMAPDSSCVNAPNLKSGPVTLNSGNLIEGEDVKFMSDLINDGADTSNLSWSDFTYRWGTTGMWQSIWNEAAVPFVNNGSPITEISELFTLNQSGTLYIQHCVDIRSDLSETNELDNCAIQTFTVAPGSPNLVSGIVALNSGTLFSGQNVSFISSVANSSPYAISTSFSDNFTYRWGYSGGWTQFGPDISRVSMTGPGVDADISTTINLNLTGPLQIQHCVDSTSQINNESDETDNCVVGTFIIASPSPDLVATVATVSAASVGQGGQITFGTGNIRNIGNVLAGPYPIGGFYIDNNNDGVADYTVAAGNIAVNTNPTLSNSRNGIVWSVPANAPAGNYRVSYIADTPDTIIESNEGNNFSGWTNFTVVTVPNGDIWGSGCEIPINGTTCPATINWTSSNFIGSPDIRRGTDFISNSPSNNNFSYPIDIDNYNFILKDLGSSFEKSYTASVGCAPGSVWAGPVGSKICMRLPEIEITANPNVIRSGKTAPLTVTITANYDMSCDIKGGTTNQIIDHYVSSGATQIYTRTTDTLTASQVVEVTCENTLYPVVNGSDSTKVEVTASFQET